MKLTYSPILPLSVLFAALVAVVPFSTAEAKMFGLVEAGYSSYDAEGATPASRDERETFYHRYLLGYQNSGRIAKGRVGDYSYLLGYEWASINQNVEGVAANLPSSASVQRGHLLFAGDVRLQLPGYPVRFNAYSRDTSSNFSVDPGVVEALRGGASTFINPMTVTMTGGTNISSGMTLDIGLLRNQRGPQLFNELPRLVLDYTDVYVSDLRSDFQQHNRTSAYTGALGKGPLWLRYSLTKYTDYLVTAPPTVTQQINVGTVDNRLQRTWIDVTNWIRVSADGQFTKQNANKDGLTGKGEQYDINLFTIATREKWSARNFNYFSQSVDRDVNKKAHTMELPFYLEGAVGIDTDWKARAVSRETKGTDPRDVTRSQLASMRLDTFKRSQFTLTPSLTVERISKPEETSLSVSGSVESASTRRFSDRLGLFGSYAVRYFTVDSNAASSDNSLQNDLSGRVSYAVTDRVKVNYGQTFSWKKGGADSNVGESSVNNQTLQNSTIGRTRDNNNEYLQSVSTGSVGWQPSARLNLSANASADVKKSAGVPLDTIISLSNNIDYSMPEYKINGRVQYATRSYDSKRTTEWGVTAGALYTPRKNLESSVRATYSFNDDENSTSSTTSFAEIKQRLAYTVERAYSARKLLQLVEESSYQYGNSTTFSTSTDASTTYKTRRNLTLIANYYPFKNLFLGASTRYSLLDPGSVNEYYYHATVGLEYNKLQAYLDYAHGRRSGTDRRVETRFSANLKKQF